MFFVLLRLNLFVFKRIRINFGGQSTDKLFWIAKPSFPVKCILRSPYFVSFYNYCKNTKTNKIAHVWFTEEQQSMPSHVRHCFYLVSMVLGEPSLFLTELLQPWISLLLIPRIHLENVDLKVFCRLCYLTLSMVIISFLVSN